MNPQAVQTNRVTRMELKIVIPATTEASWRARLENRSLEPHFGHLPEIFNGGLLFRCSANFNACGAIGGLTWSGALTWRHTA